MKRSLTDMVTVGKRAAGLILALCLAAGLLRLQAFAAQENRISVSTAEQLAQAVSAAASDTEIALEPERYDMTNWPLAGKEGVEVTVTGSGAILVNTEITGGSLSFVGADFAGEAGADGTADRADGAGGAAALVVTGGRVRISGAHITGGCGGDGYSQDGVESWEEAGGSGGAGGDGLVVSDGALVTLSGCTVAGGTGGGTGENGLLYSGETPGAGNGGTALRGNAASAADCTFTGGDAGMSGYVLGGTAADGGDGVGGVLAGAQNVAVRGGNTRWGYGGNGVVGTVIGLSGVDIFGGAGYIGVEIYYDEDWRFLYCEAGGERMEALPAVGGSGVRGEVYGEVNSITGGAGAVGGTGVEGAVHGRVGTIAGGTDPDPDHQVVRWLNAPESVQYCCGCVGGDGWRVTLSCAGAVDSVTGGRGADYAWDGGDASGAGGAGGAGVVLSPGVTFTGRVDTAAGGDGGSGHGGDTNAVTPCGGGDGGAGLMVSGLLAGQVGSAVGGGGGDGGDAVGSDSGPGGTGGSGVVVFQGAQASGIGSAAGGSGGNGGDGPDSGGGGAGGDGGAGVEAENASVAALAAIADGVGGTGGSGAPEGEVARTAGFSAHCFSIPDLTEDRVYCQTDAGGAVPAEVSGGGLTLLLPESWEGTLRAVCGDTLYCFSGGQLTEKGAALSRYDVAEGSLVISSDYCLYGGQLCPVSERYTVTGLGCGTVTAYADADIVLSGAAISADSGPALLAGEGAEVTVTLAEGTVNTLAGGEGGAGAQVERGGTLTITGMGSLKAAGGFGGAGIGGGRYAPAGTVELRGGAVSATGGAGGAGIGSGCFGGGANIRISGGDIQADSVGGGGRSAAQTVAVTGGRLALEEAADCMGTGGSVISVSGGSLVRGGVAVAPVPGGLVEVLSAGGVSLTGGGVVTKGDTQMTVTGSGVLAPDGGVLLPEGGCVSVADRDGKTVVFTIPGGGTVRPGTGGSIDLPGGASAVIDGQTVTVPEGGGVFDPADFPKRESGGSSGGHDSAGDSDVGPLGPQSTWNNPYTDVPEQAWYSGAVRFVLENGLMGGYGDGRFGPGDPLSRAQLAQVLYSWSGKPATDGSPFADVPAGRWYTDAVAWAAETGVMSGYGGESFGPNDPVIREQLAAVLWRYAGSPAPSGPRPDFSDWEAVSGYAADALRWAVENGILYGRSGGLLDPGGEASRAEVAAVLMRYGERLEVCRSGGQ